MESKALDRIDKNLHGKIMTALDAAGLIDENMTVGCSGFTMVGHPKAMPRAMAEVGKAQNLTLLTGASVGDVLDGELVRAGLLKRRYPYQTNKDLRNAINRGEVKYADFHLSHMPARLNNGGGPRINFAIIECAAVTGEGLILTAAVGASDCFVRNADKVIVEINTSIPVEIAGIHDIFRVSAPTAPAPIPICAVMDRVGTPYIPCPPEKIAAIVINDAPGEFPVFKEADSVSEKIAANIVEFLKGEIKAGRQPENLYPLQSGVGSVANAVLRGLAVGGFNNLRMYTEVLQDSALDLISAGIMTGASTTALSLSQDKAAHFFENLFFFKERIIIRPQEITNHPEVVRRLGVISMNTPIECDLIGNINSTHLLGTDVVNGIGGSGDFARNASLTIFAVPSTAKGGKISAIVPMVSHVDHTDHDVMVIVTEQGVADLRWKTSHERAKLIVDNCAHPDYRDGLRSYLRKESKSQHIPHDLDKAFDWHRRYRDTGSML